MSEQGTDAWKAERAGLITASRFADAIAVGKKGQDLASRTTYLHEIVFERLAKQPRHEVKAKSLQWGTDVESYAREAYELHSGNLVIRPPFAKHPVYPFIGASSDGWIDGDGVLELKCPLSEAVHVGTLMNGMPTEHVAQVQGNLFVTGRMWLDFVSYDPRQDSRFRLYVERIERDDDYIEALKAGLLRFEADVQAMLAAIEKKMAA